MHPVKLETKCITTTGTVSLAHTPPIVEQQLNSLSIADSYIACKDTNSWSRWELHYVEAVFRLGMEFL